MPIRVVLISFQFLHLKSGANKLSIGGRVSPFWQNINHHISSTINGFCLNMQTDGSRPQLIKYQHHHDSYPHHDYPVEENAKLLVGPSRK